MKRFTTSVCLLWLVAAQADAGIVNGVASITTGFNNTTPGDGRTVLANTGTVLDGLYGTENLAYLVDDFPGSLGYNGLIIKATAVVNEDGNVNGADNGAYLGYSNPVQGHRTEMNFGIALYHPGDGRIFINNAGNLTNIGNWNEKFGRNNPFDIDLVTSLSGNTLTVTGTISESDTPANSIVVNQAINVADPAALMSAFGTSSGFQQPGTLRNYGVDFSNVMYSSTVVIPEPATFALAFVGLALLVGRRQLRTGTQSM